MNSDILMDKVVINYTVPQFITDNNYTTDSGFFNLNFLSTINITNSKI